MELSPDQLQSLTERLAKDMERFLSARGIEPHYSREVLADLLEVEPATIDNWHRRYEETGGKEGLGPKVVFSHKCTRYAASSVKRWAASRTVDVTALAGDGGGR